MCNKEVLFYNVSISFNMVWPATIFKQNFGPHIHVSCAPLQ